VTVSLAYAPQRTDSKRTKVPPAAAFPCNATSDEIGAGRFIGWLDINVSKFHDGRERDGKVNQHNGSVPRDF
jgi:hypothetical protein